MKYQFADCTLDDARLTLTRGGNGALMWRAAEICEAEAKEAEVVNTVGAGDAFAGAAVMGLLRRDEAGAAGLFVPPGDREHGRGVQGAGGGAEGAQ